MPTIPRVVALLEEIKESLEAPRKRDLDLTRIHSKITQAQNLLVGGQPTTPEDN